MLLALIAKIGIDMTPIGLLNVPFDDFTVDFWDDKNLYTQIDKHCAMEQLTRPNSWGYFIRKQKPFPLFLLMMTSQSACSMLILIILNEFYKESLA